MSNRKRDKVRRWEAPEAPQAAIVPETLPSQGGVSYPAHWIPGTLLDLRKFTDGSYRATILGEEVDFQTHNFIDFASSHDAQQFTSTWYMPAKARVW
jgi:hypothetical protein